MLNLTNPAWWKSFAGVVAAFLAMFNVPGDLQPAVQATISAAGFLVAAVYVHEHMATSRNLDTVAGSKPAAPAPVPASPAPSTMADAASVIAGLEQMFPALVGSAVPPVGQTVPPVATTPPGPVS